MIVGNQLNPPCAVIAKLSHDNFIVYLFYFENNNYLNLSAKSVIDLVICTLDTACRTTVPRFFLTYLSRTPSHSQPQPRQAKEVGKKL